jgi:hypothetical protein
VRLPARLADHLAHLSPREVRLLLAAGALALGVTAIGTVLAVRDDLAALRARVAGRERELGEVRRLAAILRRHAPPSSPPAADGPSLIARLEAAAEATVGRERIAGMTPPAAQTTGVPGQTGMVLRVADASLSEVVRLLYALETGPPPLVVAHLELRKHTDDPTRFHVTAEVADMAGRP